MKILNSETILNTLTPAEAVETLRETIQHFDPANDSARQSVELHGGGNLLLMPSSTAKMAGIKVLTMNPNFEQTDTPMIQGQYLLFDGKTLTPMASLDGAAITSLRTPAVSIAGILDFIRESKRVLKVAIFGTGPQGRHHEETLRSTLSEIREVEVTYLSRTRPAGMQNWVKAGSAEAREVLLNADLIICATTAKSPILFKDDVREDAIIVALGSHLPDAREVDGDLVKSSQVIIEDLETAKRECGDVVMAHQEKKLKYEDTVSMRQVVCGEVQLNRKKPILFKFSGMGWEDLAIAQTIFERQTSKKARKILPAQGNCE